jgi:hypothetical protein
MAAPSGGGGMGGFSMGMNLLTQGLQTYTQMQMLKSQEKQIKTQQGLYQRLIDKRRRQMTGRALSDMGASGTDVDLEYIDKLNYEFELDKAVMNEEARIAKRALSDERRMALISGLGSMAMQGMQAYGQSQAQPNTASTLQNQSQYWKPELENPNDPMLGFKNDSTDPYGLKKKANWYSSMFGA